MENVAVPTDVQSKWKRYDKYKDSGIEWLGEVPEGWDIAAIKRDFEVQLGKMLQNNPESKDDILVPYLRAIHVRWNEVSTNDLPEMWASPYEIFQYGINRGDLLVCEGGEGGRSYIVKSKPMNCIIQNALHRVRSKSNANLVFLQYFLRFISISGWFDVICNKATITHFTQEKFNELKIALPPLSEQHAIAAFLNRETARIDALITKKERQIELLQEKRAALISHAVTKGLDPNVKLKDSGIEWLGMVPEGWGVMRLILAMEKITNGYVGPTRDIYSETGIRYLQSLHIKNGKIQFNKEYFVPEDWSNQHGKSILKEGDVLVVQTGAIGETAVVSKEFENCNCHALIILRWKHGFGIGQYLARLFQSSYGINQLLKEQTGALHPHLECGKIRDIPVLVPPMNEQIRIVNQLDGILLEIGTTAVKIQKSIDLLNECRSALISAAVTGKIDVRQEVAG